MRSVRKSNAIKMVNIASTSTASLYHDVAFLNHSRRPVSCLRKKYQLPMTRATKAKAPKRVRVAIAPAAAMASIGSDR